MALASEKEHQGVDREFVFTDRDFKKLAGLVMEKTGIMLGDHKKNMVYSRIARRLRALGLKKFQQYIDYLEGAKGDVEIADFVNAVTTNLTKFFREDHHFDHLQKEVLTPLVAKPPSGKRLRLWSAGCSSGMEAYSIAMMVFEAIPNAEQWDIKILATDIDTNMLDRGKAGVYRASDIENVPPYLKKKYCLRHGGKGSEEISIADKLRQMVHFKYMNFMDPWPVSGPFDVIFCRNVVIYFNKDTQKILFSRFAGVIKPEGWLYIGHSENISAITDKFELIGKTIHRRVVA